MILLTNVPPTKFNKTDASRFPMPLDTQVEVLVRDARSGSGERSELSTHVPTSPGFRWDFSQEADGDHLGSRWGEKTGAHRAPTSRSWEDVDSTPVTQREWR